MMVGFFQLFGFKTFFFTRLKVKGMQNYHFNHAHFRFPEEFIFTLHKL